jgi:hypothetical protein
MLLLDTPAQERLRINGKQEQSQALRQQALEQEILSNTISVETDAGRDTSDVLAQMGRPLTSTEVQRRLHLCNSNLIFERSIKFPELTGIYIEKSQRTAAGGWEKRKIFICGMESGILPELSVRHKTKKRVANKELLGSQKPTRDIDWQYVDTFAAETRGWRTVLLRLLHVGIVNRYQVEKHFGWIPSVESKKWAEQTR